MEEADSVVQAVLLKFLARSALGKIKYGVTLDRTDLSTLHWINHTQEELMDAILYLEKLKTTLGISEAWSTEQKVSASSEK